MSKKWQWASEVNTGAAYLASSGVYSGSSLALGTVSPSFLFWLLFFVFNFKNILLDAWKNVYMFWPYSPFHHPALPRSARLPQPPTFVSMLKSYSYPGSYWQLMGVGRGWVSCLRVHSLVSQPHSKGGPLIQEPSSLCSPLFDPTQLLSLKHPS